MSILKTINVVLLEDEEFSRKITIHALNKIGIDQIRWAENGQAGINLLTAPETKANLIICDIEMPEMDGYEFSRKIRLGQVPRFKSTPILILTGQDSEKNIERSKFNRIEGFIVKPVDISELENKIRTVLKISN